MELYYVLLAVAIFVSFSFRMRKFARFLYLSSKIPGPSLWKMLTVHAKHLLSDDMVTYVWELSAVYNYKPWAMWMNYRDFVIVVSDPETIEAVYKSKHTMEKTVKFYKPIDNFIGRNLLTMSGGKDYAKHRRSLMFSLRKNFLELYLPKMFTPMSEFVRKVREEVVGKKDVDIRSLVSSHIVAAAICYLTSVPPDNLPELIQLYVQHVPFRFDLLLNETINPIYYHSYVRWRPSSRHNEAVVKSLMASFDETLLNERYRNVERMNEDGLYGAFANMISLYEKLICGSDKEFCEQCRVILVGSIDTSTFVINVVFLMLALHQDVQQRLFNEISSVLGEAERPIVIEDLDRMKYMKMVIKETMRLFPVAPWFTRQSSEETILNGVLVPKRCTILMNAMAVHRNPEYFPDPLKFDPDRFSPEASREILPFSYLPFSAGTRSCPGEVQGYLMVKLFLCYAVRNFVILPGEKLKSMDDIKVKICLTMHLRNSSLQFVDRSSGKE